MEAIVPAALSLLFASSVVLKLRDRGHALGRYVERGLRRPRHRWVRSLVVGVLVAEGILSLSWLLGAFTDTVVVAWATTAFIVVVTAFSARVSLRAGDFAFDCGCFGAQASPTGGHTTIWSLVAGARFASRNAAICLLAMSTTGALYPPGQILAVAMSPVLLVGSVYLIALIGGWRDLRLPRHPASDALVGRTSQAIALDWYRQQQDLRHRYGW